MVSSFFSSVVLFVQLCVVTMAEVASFFVGKADFLVEGFKQLVESALYKNDNMALMALVSFACVIYHYFVRREREIYVAQLYYYPIKGCRGTRVSEVELCPTGIKHDRRWMIVNHKGHMVTQRQIPKICQICPLVLDDGALLLRAPTMWSAVCPLKEDGLSIDGLKIWDDVVDGAVDQGDDVSDWLNDFLDTEGLRLVYMTKPDACTRVIPEKYNNRSILGNGPAVVGFADAFGYLLLGVESLTNLNLRIVKKGQDPLPMERFRPNIVTIGGKPFEEDTFELIKIADCTFAGLKPCTRCIVTTTDQESGDQAGIRGEPLVTFRSFRQDPDNKNKVYFGENLNQVLSKDKQGTDESTGVLRVGDKITVVRRKVPLV